MSNNTLAELKKLLVKRYAALRARLEFVAGSRENAAEVLHETWMRLENMTEIGPVANPDGFLIRMASNVAIDRHRREARHQHETPYLHDEDVEEAFDVPDELANPERIVASRLQLEALEKILLGLSPRQRAILWAAHVDGQLNREIAERFNISLRLVEKELRIALTHCHREMWQKSYMDKAERVSKIGRRSV